MKKMKPTCWDEEKDLEWEQHHRDDVVRLRIEQHFCRSEVVGEEAELKAIEGTES